MSTHVESSLIDSRSWCGVTLTSDFYFKGVEQAVLNGIHLSKYAACPECVEKIIDALKNSCKVFHEEQQETMAQSND